MTTQWLLERRTRDGFLEQIVYTGPRSRKPTGWRLVQALDPPPTKPEQVDTPASSR